MRRLALTALALAALALGASAWQLRTQPARPQTLLRKLPDETLAALFASQFTDQHGKTQDLAQWRGQALLINFWASWCPPCREEIPLLARMHRNQSDKTPKIIGISVDLADKSQKTAINHGATYPLLLSGERGIDLMRTLGNTSLALPYTLLIDPQGKVILQQAGLVPPAMLDAAWRQATHP